MKNRYIRLYKEFREYNTEIQEEPEVELSDKTIDDVLSDDFFDNVDKDKVIIISNWKVY